MLQHCNSALDFKIVLSKIPSTSDSQFSSEKMEEKYCQIFFAEIINFCLFLSKSMSEGGQNSGGGELPVKGGQRGGGGTVGR